MAEADFARFYQKDLRVEAETEGCRRLWVLIQGLPQEAAIWRVDGQAWTTQHELLAIAAEMSERAVRAAVGMKTPVLKEPLRLPRPGESQHAVLDRSNRVITDPREIARFFS